MVERKKEVHNIELLFYCDFAGIQTRNLLIRSQMLYSVELRSLFLIAFAKVILFIGKAEKQATIILRVNFY